MKGERKSKAQLIEEIHELRLRISEMEGVVTETRRAEESLKGLEEPYRALFEGSTNPVTVLDRNGVVLMVNPAAARHVGLTQEKCVGRSVFDLTPSLDKSNLEAYRQVVDKGETITREDLVGYPEGSRWFLSVLQPIYDSSGRRYAVEAISYDITEHKQAEQEITETKEFYGSILNSIVDGVWVTDKNDVIFYTNKGMEKIAGIPTEQIVGTNVLTGFPESTLEFFRSYYLEAKREKRPVHYDAVPVVTPAGRESFQSGWLIPLKKDVKFDGMICTVEDITEHKRTLERQEKLSFLLQNLGPDFLENMEMLIGTGRDILEGEIMNYCRLDKGRLYCALSTVPGEGLNLTNRPHEHVCYEVISTGREEPLAINDLAATEYQKTDPFVRKYGLMSFLGYPVFLKNKPIGCLSLFTKERRAFSPEEMGIMSTLSQALGTEEERLAREEDLKDFIDIASHELRHPVTIVKGYAISLRDLWDKFDERNREEILNAIDRGVDRLNRLVLELLDVSRIERGRFSLRKGKAGLQHLMKEVLAEIEDRSKDNEFKLSIPDEITTLNIDSEKLSEAIFILLDNAVVYSPAGSEIDVETVVGEDEVIISVLDRGIGVPEDHRERIFERFGQVEDALHHSAPGMGMGLYIAKEIVEAHGGRIWHEPREGGGSIFRLAIPF